MMMVFVVVVSDFLPCQHNRGCRGFAFHAPLCYEFLTIHYNLAAVVGYKVQGLVLLVIETACELAVRKPYVEHVTVHLERNRVVLLVVLHVYVQEDSTLSLDDAVRLADVVEYRGWCQLDVGGQRGSALCHLRRQRDSVRVKHL